MADVERRVSGAQNIVSIPIESSVVVEKGDFICLSSGNAIPAGDVSDAGDAQANREAGADAFIGVAITASASGKTDNLQVDIGIDSIVSLTQQTAGALSFGDLVEIYADTHSCADDTIVAGTSSPIAVCVQSKASTGVRVDCKLVPQLLLNTPQT